MNAAVNSAILLGVSGLFTLQAPQSPLLTTPLTSQPQAQATPSAPTAPNGAPQYKIQRGPNGEWLISPGSGSNRTVAVLPGTKTPNMSNIPECWIIDQLKIGPNGERIIEGHNDRGVRTWVAKPLLVAPPRSAMQSLSFTPGSAPAAPGQPIMIAPNSTPQTARPGG